MNTPLKLTALMGAVLFISACYSSGSKTVYCGDKSVGTEFTHNEITYLVVGDETIDDHHNMSKLKHGIWRFYTSHVTNMNRLFAGEYAFNQPIGEWDVSNVTDMEEMFFMATAFNQPIGDWNVAKVQDMLGMFYGATAFKQNLDHWAQKPMMPWEYEE